MGGGGEAANLKEYLVIVGGRGGGGRGGRGARGGNTTYLTIIIAVDKGQ